MCRLTSSEVKAGLVDATFGLSVAGILGVPDVGVSTTGVSFSVTGTGSLATLVEEVSFSLCSPEFSSFTGEAAFLKDTQ